MTLLKLPSVCAAMFALFVACHCTVAAERSTEYDLAIINAGGYVPEDHITVKRFAYLLRQLDAKFPEDAKKIADLSVWGVGKLRDNGIEQKPLELMEGMNQLFASPVENQTYTDHLTAYLAMRMEGHSHGECIAACKALIEALLP